MRALLPIVLLLCSCTKNQAELRAILAAAEVQLAARQEAAARLNDDMQAAMQAEADMAGALAEFPEEKGLLEDAPLPPPSVKPTFAPLPPESVFEGAEGARLRRQIDDTQRRIEQLAIVLGNVDQANARTKQLKRQLAQIRERHPPK